MSHRPEGASETAGLPVGTVETNPTWREIMRRCARELGSRAPRSEGDKTYTAVDSHTAGMPTRIIADGIGILEGNSMLEKMNSLRTGFDDVRQLLMLEPRGHSAMCGVVVQPPLTPEADVGALFITAGGYLPMCGHAAIGLSSALVVSGAVTSTGELATIRIDGSVVSCDLATCGGLYAVVRGRDLGLEFKGASLAELTSAGEQMMTAVNDLQRDSPTPSCEHVIITWSGSDGGQRRSVVVHRGFVDRSPCGTGTSAWMACLYTRGNLRIGGGITNQALNGGEFTGQIISARDSTDPYAEITTNITGRAWITGFGTYLLERDDPLGRGFAL